MTSRFAELLISLTELSSPNIAAIAIYRGEAFLHAGCAKG
jgi:hypothetical protein